MRLLKEIPEVEKKITSGELSLSNVSQAQSFFRRAGNDDSNKPIEKETKLAILGQLENKSVRDAQKELAKLQPTAALPEERERLIIEGQMEVRFLMDDDLKRALEEVRSLLGPRGAAMTYAELFSKMSQLATDSLRAKKFGKKRSQQKISTASDDSRSLLRGSDEKKTTINDAKHSKSLPLKQRIDVKPVQEGPEENHEVACPQPATSRAKSPGATRYISKATRYHVWQRDLGRCTNCGVTRNLQIDHIQPVALGGDSHISNLRILCNNCNQRVAMKIFGVNHMRSSERRGPNRTSADQGKFPSCHVPADSPQEALAECAKLQRESGGTKPIEHEGSRLY